MSLYLKILKNKNDKMFEGEWICNYINLTTTHCAYVSNYTGSSKYVQISYVSFKKSGEIGVVIHTYNLGTWEAWAEGSWVPGQSRLHSQFETKPNYISTFKASLIGLNLRGKTSPLYMTEEWWLLL
jgi:hypothetical protein